MFRYSSNGIGGSFVTGGGFVSFGRPPSFRDARRFRRSSPDQGRRIFLSPPCLPLHDKQQHRDPELHRVFALDFDRLDWQLARLRRELETAARFADEGTAIISELAGYSGSSGRYHTSRQGRACSGYNGGGIGGA
jgi:hypothetical protein